MEMQLQNEGTKQLSLKMATIAQAIPLACVTQKTSQQMTPKDVQMELTKFWEEMLKAFNFLETQQAWMTLPK
jgi:hypothetical protein